MKPTEVKQRFIQLRAEGKSYSYICEELGIAKGTCTEWNRELEDEIARCKREELNALYETFHMRKRDRIERLGGTLEKIEDTLATADLSQIPTEKLLDYKLKYTEALQKEYTDTTPAFAPGETITATSIMAAMADLINRVKAGEVSAEQASRESAVLANLLKAFEDVEIKAKVERLESILDGRTNDQR